MERVILHGTYSCDWYGFQSVKRTEASGRKHKLSRSWEAWRLFLDLQTPFLHADGLSTMLLRDTDTGTYDFLAYDEEGSEFMVILAQQYY